MAVCIYNQDMWSRRLYRTMTSMPLHVQLLQMRECVEHIHRCVHSHTCTSFGCADIDCHKLGRLYNVDSIVYEVMAQEESDMWTRLPHSFTKKGLDLLQFVG